MLRKQLFGGNNSAPTNTISQKEYYTRLGGEVWGVGECGEE
ncbi:hypothetical protein [Dapis sp. BLCC M229]